VPPAKSAGIKDRNYLGDRACRRRMRVDGTSWLAETLPESSA